MDSKLSTRCYLCGKTEVSYHFSKLGYDIYKCLNCGHLLLRFDQDYQTFINSYYQKGYFTGNKAYRAYANYSDDKQNILINSRKILKEVKTLVPHGNLLDVGCAMGFFMEEATRQDYDCFGIEVSQYAGKIAQKTFGDRVFLGSVEEFVKKRSKSQKYRNLQFDVIVLSDIIEHLENPRGVLIELKKLLTKKGVIVLQTGDTSSLWAQILGKNWHFFAPPQHLHFFSQRTLTELLKQAGYQVFREKRVGKHVSLRYIFHMSNYMNIPKIGDLFLQLFANSVFAKLSLPVKLFDNMVLYARKK